MADEISIKISLKMSKSPMQDINVNPATFTVDMSGTDYIYATQNIGTSAENLAQGDVGTPGWMIVHNLDATNFVELGYDDTGFKPFVKLKGNATVAKREWAMFRTTQATPQAKAGRC